MDQVLQSNRLSLLKYYNKSEKDIEIDVDIVLTSIKQLAHFPKFKDENALRQKIEAYLIYNKFRIEVTKKKLDMCYAYKNIYPEFFENWNALLSREFEPILRLCRCLSLPYLTKNLHRITIIEIPEKLPDDYDPINHVKVCLMTLETRFLNDHNTREIVIYDCSNVNMALLTKFTPSLTKKIFDIFLKGYTFQLEGAHVLYPLAGLEFLMNTVVKPIVKPKLYERVYLHNDLDSLHKVIPKELLPKNYGGNLPHSEILTDQWYEILKNNRAYLVEESERCSDESKRIDNNDEFFGSMHGSFKKLEFD